MCSINVIFQDCYKQHLNSAKVDFEPFCIAENTELLLWHETKLFLYKKLKNVFERRARFLLENIFSLNNIVSTSSVLSSCPLRPCLNSNVPI